MAEASTHDDSSSNPTSTIIPTLINPANQINTVKLSDDNFLLWNLQILAGIRGLGLENYIMENPHVPPETTSATTADLLNPSYVTFHFFWPQ